MKCCGRSRRHRSLRCSLLDAPFPAVIAAAALIGYVGGRIAPKKFAVGGGHSATSDKSFGPAIIDDDTPTPSHAAFNRRRLGRSRWSDSCCG